MFVVFLFLLYFMLLNFHLEQIFFSWEGKKKKKNPLRVTSAKLAQ